MRLEIGDHFTVSFEGPEDAAMAAQALQSLNKAFWRICDVFGTFPIKSVPVVLYSGEQFSDITRSPKWAAAAFDGIIRVPMRGADEKGEDLDRVLAHEFSHALIRSLATRGLPTWLNEGLASVLESDDLGWATKGACESCRKGASLKALSRSVRRASGCSNAQDRLRGHTVAAKRLLNDRFPKPASRQSSSLLLDTRPRRRRRIRKGRVPAFAIQRFARDFEASLQNS
jgi:hypothetical protein